MEAVLKARDEGPCRHIGITGHQDPGVLLEAMRRFQFDTVLTVVNPAEPTGRHSFMRQVIPKARRRGMGVNAMKSLPAAACFPSPAPAPRLEEEAAPEAAAINPWKTL